MKKKRHFSLNATTRSHARQERGTLAAHKTHIQSMVTRTSSTVLATVATFNVATVSTFNVATVATSEMQIVLDCPCFLSDLLAKGRPMRVDTGGRASKTVRSQARAWERATLTLIVLLVALSPATVGFGQETKAPGSASEGTLISHREMVDRGVEFLRVRGQADDGSFSKQNGLGVSALVTASLLAVDVSREDPMVAKALKYLESFQQPDGGIYAPNSKHSNYETCLAIMAIARANRDGKYDVLLKRAEAFVKKLQWDDGEGLQSDDPAYGGAGYGSKSRPDLSNTSFLLEALNTLGRDGEDEAVKRALVFVSRCQNRASADNPTPFATMVNDGGFYYTPAAGGDSMAGKTETGGLRSYASMTYAGLKSMIFAGVEKDDARVQAATKFLETNYSLDSNPGMGTSGLFYYYHTMAKALNALGVEQFKAVDGEHAWRIELLSTLAKSQKEDGSWVNTDSRWLEGDPNLVTGYTLLTLGMLKPKE